jgi:conjugative transfer signal peptidase TraF
MALKSASRPSSGSGLRGLRGGDFPTLMALKSVSQLSNGGSNSLAPRPQRWGFPDFNGIKVRTPPRLPVLFALLIAVPFTLSTLGLRINTSASLPLGLYRLTDRPPVRSSLVLVCPPQAAAHLARTRSYLPAGACPGGVQPLGKMVLATAGDTVEVSARGLAVDGQAIPASRPSAADSAGRPLRAFPLGVYHLSSGELWLYAPHPRSFDSRYFGAVSSSRLLGALQPLWTDRSARLDATAALLRALDPRP